MVLSVPLLATKTSILCKSLSVGPNIAKPREHGQVIDVFSASFEQNFLDLENRLYRRDATITWRSYRRISNYFEIACLCSPHVPGMPLVALMKDFNSTTAILARNMLAVLLLLWC